MGDPDNNMGMYNYNQWMQLLGGRENRQAWAAGNYELDSGVVLDFQIGVSKGFRSYDGTCTYGKWS